MDRTQFEVLESFALIEPLLPTLRAAADADRDALGFYAEGVFREFARLGKLLVLACKGADPQYAAHLLFDRRFPRAKVLQLHVMPPLRGRGLAGLLLNHLRQSLTKDGFTSISARVAEELTQANRFWSTQQFYVQRTEPGGATRNRAILVRCHELATPQLFPPAGLDENNPLGLSVPASNELPVYLLDLNVLFDFGPRRQRRPEALSILQVERMDFCRLAVSDEAQSELQRTATPGRTDPMADWIAIFPIFPLSDQTEVVPLLQELREIVFPGKTAATMTPNETSDVRHIATAVANKLAGLITNDTAMLNAAVPIARRFGIQVLSSAAFRPDTRQAPARRDIQSVSRTVLSLDTLHSGNVEQIRTFLSTMGLSASALASGWLHSGPSAASAPQWLVSDGHHIIGYLTWLALAPESTLSARAIVDEQNAQAQDAARILLTHLIDQLIRGAPRRVLLHLAPRQSILRDLANGLGFCSSRDAHILIKAALGRLITPDTWELRRQELKDLIDIRLSERMPPYRHPDPHIEVGTPDGNRHFIGLLQLESLLSPVLIILPGRPAVITPIRTKFAESLFGHARQGTLLPSNTSSQYRERHYVSGPQTFSQLRPGTLMLFYESLKDGGRGELIAAARVTESYQKAATALRRTDLEKSVLTTDNLSDIGAAAMKSVTAFDNVFLFDQPIPLKRLRALGCGQPAQLITTRAISDTQLQSILREGFIDAQ
jgi:GNAT superfamily N-acetyltransferase